MAWTAPMTAVAGSPLTAAQFNTHGRDDLNMLAPAYATAAGGWITTAGYNTLAQRIPSVSYVGSSGSTDSTSYTDLSTAGATVTAKTGVRAIVSIGGQISNSSAGLGGRIGVAMSGASTADASDLNSFYCESANAGDAFKGTWSTIYDPLTPGDSTWTLKYRASGGGVATFSGRDLVIIPF